MASPLSAPMAMSPDSDRELLASARDGDSRAYARLVGRYERRVFRLALHLLRNEADADDVTQETFVRAWGALSRFDGRSEPFTWVYRIAVNLSLNQLRSRRVRKHTELDEDPRVESALADQRSGITNPEADTRDHELMVTLGKAMDTLSDTLRTTLILVGVDGLSHTEAAEILGCPEGTIAWRVHEARKKLREHFLAHGVELGEDA